VSAETVQTAGVAVTPRVNLMPPEIAEAARFRRLQMVMAGAVAVAVVIVAFLYMNAKSGVSSAQNQVDAASQQHTALQTKLNGLSTVEQTYSEVSAKQALLTQAMGQEVRWSYLLNDLSLRLPSNVWLTGLEATESAAGSTSAVTTLPGTNSTSAPIGTVAFSGVGLKHDDVATLLDSLAKERGLEQPVFSNSTENTIGSRNVVVYSVSSPLDSKALSLRYTQKAGS